MGERPSERGCPRPKLGIRRIIPSIEAQWPSRIGPVATGRETGVRGVAGIAHRCTARAFIAIGYERYRPPHSRLSRAGTYVDLLCPLVVHYLYHPYPNGPYGTVAVENRSPLRPKLGITPLIQSIVTAVAKNRAQPRRGTVIHFLNSKWLCERRTNTDIRDSRYGHDNATRARH